MEAISRLKKELALIQCDPEFSATTYPLNDDLFTWHSTIKGPDETPYEGGEFDLVVYFPKEFPFKPPTCKFVTRIFHPNIGAHGHICLDILGKKWNPALTIRQLLLSICSLLADPNHDDPLVPEVARLYQRNQEEYYNRCKEWTRLYAMFNNNNNTISFTTYNFSSADQFSLILHPTLGKTCSISVMSYSTTIE